MKSLKFGLILAMLSFVFGFAIGCGDEKKKNSSSPGIVVPGGPNNPNNPYPIDGNTSLWGETFTITNRDLYREFLREYGVVCDPYSWLNFGSISCRNWDSQAYLEVALYAKTVPAFGFARLYAYPEGIYSPINPGVPVYVQGQFQPIENNSKFELRAYGRGGTYSYNAILRVVVNGLPTDTTVRVDLYYRNQVMGYGILYRN